MALTFLTGFALVNVPNSQGAVAQQTASATSTIPVPVFTADHPPTIAPFGGPYSYSFTATGQPKTIFSLGSGALPPGLVLDESGLLAGSATRSGAYTFTVSARLDTAPAVLSAPHTILVPEAPRLTNASPPPATIDAAYSYAFSAVGTPAPTFMVTAGILPPGLTLSAGGLLTGIPNGAGEFTFAVGADNGVAPVAIADPLTITVSGAPLFTADAPPSAIAGVPYSYTFAASGSPSPTFLVTEGALPDGLTLTPSGELAGTPTTAGAASFSVTASNGVGPDAVWAMQPVLVNAGRVSAVVVAPQTPSGAGYQAVAGAPITFEVSARDPSGAVQPGQVATYTLGAGAAMPGIVRGNTIVFTYVGTHTVDVWLGTTNATITVRVLPGPPAEVVLSASATAIDPGASITLALSGLDAYGNKTGDLTNQAVFSSDHSDDAISGETVTFPYASPRLITASLGALSSTIPIEVTEPTVPSPSPTSSAPATALPDSARLASGGTAASPLFFIALGLVVAGLVVVGARGRGGRRRHARP